MVQSIKVKRQIIVKTLMTEDFKVKAKEELLDEMKLIDGQINHFQLQLNQLIQQIQQSSIAGLAPAAQETEQIINDLNIKLQQLLGLKQNMHLQIENVDNAQTGEYIVTGSLENYVDLNVGDNIYETLVDKEIIIKDGIVQEINV